MSQVCAEGFQICYAGGVHIEKQLSQLIREDNARLLAKIIPEVPHYAHDLPSKILEDVKIRALFVMQHPQKKEWIGLSDPEFKKNLDQNK